MKILALDFGGSSVKYGVVSEDAVITESGKLPAPLGSVEQFGDTIAVLSEKYWDQISGIGISLPGNIDPETGILVENGVYKKLYGYNIIRLAEEASGLPVAAENDGKCGALSEVWDGGLKDCRDGVVVILGSAIAGGIVKDRRIHGGRFFNAGEFSCAVTIPGDYSKWSAAFMSAGMIGVTYKLCKMKNLDLTIQDSSPTMAMLDREFAGKYPVYKETPQRIKADGRQFAAWLDAGDPDAEKVYRELVVSLGALLFNIQICYAPEKIVLGGGFSSYKHLLPDLTEEVTKYCEGMRQSSRMKPVLARSRFLEQANLLGAAYNWLLRKQVITEVRKGNNNE